MTKLNFHDMKLVKDIIRNPYAWPGGYERLAITKDYCLLCHHCLKDNYYSVAHSTLHSVNDGWLVAGQCLDNEIEESELCAHCNKQLSPYIED